MITKSRISFIRSLHLNKNRHQHGMFVCEGIKSVEEAISSGFEVTEIYGTEKFSALPGIQTVSDNDIDRMSSLKTPQGILAVCKIPQYELPVSEQGKLYLALDSVQDPGNLGTIIRTADWFGIRDIVCSHSTADCYNPKVVQSTMGSLFRVRVHYTDLDNWLSASNIPVYGTFMDGESIYDLSDKDKISGIIVIGNEGSGISQTVTTTVDRRITIPAFTTNGNRPESLNAAVSTGIICAEFRRK